MNIEYVEQPDNHLGKIVAQLLDSKPKRTVFIFAFVGLQTIMRVKDQVLNLKKKGSDIRFILGIDLGGTSQEAQKEVIGWNISVCIVKHRIPDHTFRPKLYLFELDNKAEIIIGSNNITEGGFFGNYKGCARMRS